MEQTVGVGLLNRIDARNRQRAMRDDERSLGSDDEVEASPTEVAEHLLPWIESWISLVAAIIVGIAMWRRRASRCVG